MMQSIQDKWTIFSLKLLKFGECFISKVLLEHVCVSVSVRLGFWNKGENLVYYLGLSSILDRLVMMKNFNHLDVGYCEAYASLDISRFCFLVPMDIGHYDDLKWDVQRNWLNIWLLQHFLFKVVGFFGHLHLRPVLLLLQYLSGFQFVCV